ncbi:hypothetical protein U9M48_001543, partial [Paspalum notatum var. saurae]
MCISVYGKTTVTDSEICSAVGPLSMDTSKKQLEGTATLTCVEGPDSGVFPSHGSLFEFEIGTGAVSNQLESCVTQLSVNQTALFVAELPSRHLILAAPSEFLREISNISRGAHVHTLNILVENCFLEFSAKVLQVTEPLEDRMEKALLSPPLSKQRVEFAVRHINELRATTLLHFQADFGCGSGSLVDSLLEHPTTLEKLSLHQKLSNKSLTQTTVRSAVLYDGSITNYDSRLYDFDTCLEASLFGNVILSSLRPTVLIVSTLNYEYNPILQRSAMPNKDDEADKNAGPYKFQNHDHKFEWIRAQFQCWATDLAVKHNYSGVGGSGEEPGYASQIAVFRRMVRDQEPMCLDEVQDRMSFSGNGLTRPYPCDSMQWERSSTLMFL